MCLDFVQKINLKAIDRYENDEDTSDEDNKKNEEVRQFSAERSSLSALALYPCSSPGSIKARFFFASSSLSHGARGGLLFDDPHDNKFDDDNVAFDGAENVNDDVDNVDIFADY
ncbi:3691_t:CDS:2 [Entrophospora sp. SA101]|nr:3691_t:CDS:2 [Entrophospora sp. SA101]